MVTRIFIGFIAIIGIIALALALVGPPAFLQAKASPEFIIKDARGDTEFLRRPAAEIERIEMEWIHSVEKEPWREVYRIQDGELILTDVYLEAFGAGVPSDLEGTTVNEGGTVHTSGINRALPSLNWVHSHSTRHTVSVYLSGTQAPIILDDELPHQTFATAFVSSD